MNMVSPSEWSSQHNFLGGSTSPLILRGFFLVWCYTYDRMINKYPSLEPYYRPYFSNFYRELRKHGTTN